LPRVQLAASKRSTDVPSLTVQHRAQGLNTVLTVKHRAQGVNTVLCKAAPRAYKSYVHTRATCIQELRAYKSYVHTRAAKTVATSGSFVFRIL